MAKATLRPKGDDPMTEHEYLMRAIDLGFESGRGNGDAFRQVFGDSHFVEFDAPKLGSRARALCGEIVEAASASSTPTCALCKQRLADDEAALAVLMEDR
jgi:hypothetical protein